MSKIDLVSFWYQSGNIGMAPYVNTSADGGHIDYEGVYSKVDLNTRMQSIVSSLPDFFDSYTIKLTDVNLSGILVSKAECVLKSSGSSSSPDYTQVLTRIANALDTNTQDNVINKLQAINEKFSFSNRNVAQQLELLFRCFNDNEPSSSAAGLKVGSLIGSLVLCLSGVGRNQMTNNFELSDRSMLRDISRKLMQSVSPNANITDVISALNTTIDSKQDTTIVNNDNTNLVQVEGVLDYRLKPQDTM